MTRARTNLVRSAEGVVDHYQALPEDLNSSKAAMFVRYVDTVDVEIEMSECRGRYPGALDLKNLFFASDVDEQGWR